MLPDYAGGSLVNLMASIVRARGAAPLHAPLRLLRSKDAEACEARNLILLMIDGLGDRLLMRRAAGGELARRRLGALTSVFPSTTASAITTSYTGRSPLEHGLTGWYTYFGEAGCVAATLPFRSRGDNRPLQERGFAPERAFACGSIFEAIPQRSIVVTHREIVDSAYNLRHCRGAERRAYETLEELVAQVELAVKSGPERKLVYAYWQVYDSTSHRHGCESAEALAELAKIDAAFGALLGRLSGTESLVLASADHGFVDVPPDHCLEPPEAISSRLRFPLCGERRVAYCHVHGIEAFMEQAKAWLGERADVLPSASLAEAGWFGPGEPHPRLAERIGDVALVMRGRYTVKDWIPGEPRHLHIGNHGGPSEDEMLIPLIMEKA